MLRLSLVAIALCVTGCQLQPITSQVTNTTAVMNNSVTNIAVTNAYTLKYRPTQCETLPWGNVSDETAITNYYLANYNVVLDAVEVTAAPAGFVSCQACGCPTGQTIIVTTNTAGKAILKADDFIPEVVTPSTPPIEDPVQTTDATNDTTEPDLSADDQALRDQAQLVQSYLKEYFQTHQAYPNDLTDLQNVDLTGIHYTPIGTTPATYYDLSVDYSTGKVVVNP